MATSDIVVLDPPIEWMEYCAECEGIERQVAGWECSAGLLVFCSGCASERVVPFSRVTTEVA